MQGTITPNTATEAQGRQATGLAVEMARLGARMFGIGTALVGTAPKLGNTEWKIQAGTNTVSSGSTITFPNAFPVCVLGLVLWGNTNGYTWFQTVGLTSFKVYCSAAGSFSVSWIAVGC